MEVRLRVVLLRFFEVRLRVVRLREVRFFEVRLRVVLLRFFEVRLRVVLLRFFEVLLEVFLLEVLLLVRFLKVFRTDLRFIIKKHTLLFYFIYFRYVLGSIWVEY